MIVLLFLLFLNPLNPLLPMLGRSLAAWNRFHESSEIFHRLYFRSNTANLRYIRDELRKEIPQMQRLLRNPPKRSGPYLPERDDLSYIPPSILFSTFTDDQIEEMWAKKYATEKGLPVSHLRPDQYKLLDQTGSSKQLAEYGIPLRDATILFTPYGNMEIYARGKNGFQMTTGGTYLRGGGAWWNHH